MTVRAIWFLTFTLFAGVGIGVVWWPASETVSELRSAAAGYYDEAARNEDQVRQAAQLRTVRREVVTDLRSLVPAHSTGAATATMLQLLAAEQKTYNVNVRSVVPSVSPEATTPAKAATPAPFDETSIEIALTGGFAQILHFVADVPRHGALLDVRDISLTDSGGDAASPTLTVTLHATLYRFRGEIPGEDTNATSAP